MNIAICDDEEIFVEQVVELIKKQPDYDLFMSIETFFSGEKLIGAIKENKQYDLIFLDIMLEKMNGIKIVELLQDYDCIFVLISSNHNYVAKAFNLQVSQYLFKPINEKDFEETFKRCVALYEKKQQFLLVTVDRLEYKLPLKDIVYFESDKRKIKAVDKNGQKFEFYNKLDSLEQIFMSWHLSNMLRVHRSFIVNLDYCVDLVEHNIHLQGEKNINKYVRMSIRKEKEVKNRIMEYWAVKMQ